MKGLLILLSFFFLGGCNYYKWGYNHSERVISWKLDSYLDLNSSQEPLAQAQTDTFAHWHRTTQLYPMKRALQSAQKRLKKKQYKRGVQEGMATYKTLRDDLYQGFIQAITPILATLSIDQIEHLRGVLEKENLEMQQSLTPLKPERLAKRIDNFKEHMSSWLGELSPQQDQMIEKLFVTLPELLPLRLAYRQKEQARFFTFLRSQPELNALGERLTTLWIERPQNAPYTKALAKSSKLYEDFLINLLKSTDEKQRIYFLDKLTALEKDLHSLAIP